MNSPLQGGGRRRFRGFGAPTAGTARPRRPRAGYLLALLVCTLLAIAGWLVYGAAETSDPGATAAGRSPAKRAHHDRPRDRSDAVAKAVELERPDTLGIRLNRPPRGGLLFDLDSGEVLWRHGARQPLPVASLTKIMTALIVVDRAKPGERVRVTRRAIDFSGSAVGLPRGERVPVESLMNAMLIQSGNDAATALAIGVAGSQHRFVQLMNRRAERLGLRCSRFVSPDGLEPANRSCAADLAALARLAMAEPRIARIVHRDRAIVRVPIEGGRLHLATTNPLLESNYPGTIGLKTGFTQRAGRSLVGVVHRRGRKLGAVLIDSGDPARDARALFGKAFAHR